MKTLSIINLKGGVAKTISSVTMAYILAAEKGYRVLLVDNDKQGNASKMLSRYGYEHRGIEHVMTERLPNMAAVIQHTDYDRLDIIAANMNLINANMEVQMDERRKKQDRIRKALTRVKDRYDFCIIDNAPDINISTANALAASDYVMIPIMMDDFASDGMKEVIEQIIGTSKNMNPDIELLGCFVTQYVAGDESDKKRNEELRGSEYPVFTTCIRYTRKVKPATFEHMPVPVYSTKCAASVDYRKLVKEFLERTEYEEI